MNETLSRLKPAMNGMAGMTALLAIYLLLLTLLSGWTGAVEQFLQFWYFIVALAIGFGIQIGLYSHLKGMIMNGEGGKGVLKVTGTTSTVAMISCCTHYLANLLPIIGTVGIVSFVAQYQIGFFWVGLIFNLGGIAFMADRINKFKKS